MGDFAFTCSGLIQLIKIMSLPRRSHTYLPGEVGNKAQTESTILKNSIFQDSSLLQMHWGCQGMFFPKYMYPIETIL